MFTSYLGTLNPRGFWFTQLKMSPLGFHVIIILEVKIKEADSALNQLVQLYTRSDVVYYQK